MVGLKILTFAPLFIWKSDIPNTINLVHSFNYLKSSIVGAYYFIIWMFLVYNKNISNILYKNINIHFAFMIILSNISLNRPWSSVWSVHSTETLTLDTLTSRNKALHRLLFHSWILLNFWKIDTKCPKRCYRFLAPLTIQFPLHGGSLGKPFSSVFPFNWPTFYISWNNWVHMSYNRHLQFSEDKNPSVMFCLLTLDASPL